MTAHTEAIPRDRLDALYRYALRRCSSTADAQDLAQEIALELLRSLPRRRSDRSFDAWMWTIANRAFWRRMEKERRRRGIIAVNAVPEDLPGRETDDPAQDLLRRTELGSLRREIALLASSYREVLVLHYLEGVGTGEIAARLGLPLGTVTWRLHEARRSIRKGMTEMKENGQRSYAPGRLWVRMNGYVSGERPWLPWEVFGRSLPQNIALAAYRKPMSLGELALELGVSRPFIEDEVALLCERQALRKSGRDSYETDFTILCPEEVADLHALQQEAARRITPELLRSLGSREERIRAIGFHDASFDWAYLLWLLVPLTVYEGSKRLAERIGYRIEYPKRPNGSWFLVGAEGGPDDLPLEGGLTVASDSVPEGGTYQSGVFWTNRLTERAGLLTRNEASLARRLFGPGLDAAALSDTEAEIVARLVTRGYARRAEGKVLLNAVGFTKAQYDATIAILRDAAAELVDALADLYRRMEDRLHCSVPRRLHAQLPHRLETLCLDVAWHAWDELCRLGAIRMPRDPATATEGIYLVYDR